MYKTNSCYRRLEHITVDLRYKTSPAAAPDGNSGPQGSLLSLTDIR